MINEAITKIAGTAYAPYVARYVTDERAVEFRHHLTNGWEAWEFDRSDDIIGRFVAIHETGMRRFDSETADRIAADILTA